LVVFVADHGVAFEPGVSRRYVSPQNLAQVGSVPLFVKAPGQRTGHTSDALVTTLDVFPTIADYLGTDWPSEGRSLRKPLDRPRVTVTSTNNRQVSAARAQFALLRLAAERRLRVASKARKFSLRGAPGRRRIRGPSGRSIAVVPGAVAGFVESVKIGSQAVSATGWGAVKGQGPADYVLMFVDGKLVAEAEPNVDRADLVEGYGAQSKKAGFQVAGVVKGDNTPSESDIQVLAVKGDRASELEHLR
jgi:hypothetical protein